jgi:hypothetical protein
MFTEPKVSIAEKELYVSNSYSLALLDAEIRPPLTKVRILICPSEMRGFLWHGYFSREGTRCKQCV